VIFKDKDIWYRKFRR